MSMILKVKCDYIFQYILEMGSSYNGVTEYYVMMDENCRKIDVSSNLVLDIHLKYVLYSTEFGILSTLEVDHRIAGVYVLSVYGLFEDVIRLLLTVYQGSQSDRLPIEVELHGVYYSAAYSIPVAI